MDIVERIKDLCEQKNVKIKPLEESLGLSNGAIRQWNTKSPSCDRILKVAQYFNVSIEYLLTGSDPGIEKYLSYEELELIQKYRQLDFNSQQKLLHFIEVSLCK